MKSSFEIPFTSWVGRKRRYKIAKKRLARLKTELELPNYHVENPRIGLARMGFPLQVHFTESLPDEIALQIERALIIGPTTKRR